MNCHQPQIVYYVISLSFVTIDFSFKILSKNPHSPLIETPLIEVLLYLPTPLF